MNRMARIAVLAGDGIGPEIIDQALKVLDALRSRGFTFSATRAPVGGAAIDALGHPLPAETLALARQSDAVLFGAVGAPEYDTLPPPSRPEQAILGLRRELGLFAAVKRVAIPAALTHLSPLKNGRASGVDLMVVRELNGDVYTGQPKGERPAPDGPFAGQREGFDTMRYAEGEVRRIAHVAFRMAERRSGRLCSVDKSNVLATSRLWREVVTDVGRDYPRVKLEHLYADNAVIRLISSPACFDVILTANLFGDILSDAAAILTGSIGLPASALLGDGTQGLYEAGHGTAMDLAGRDMANPVACIRAAALMLRHSLARPDLADVVDQATDAALMDGVRTPDLAGTRAAVGTRAMGDAVVARLGTRA
ncbi:3-isopropylmalate dehydrogenase [Pseudaquabacterium rugosum]|uniref:3-isopropylmalate dehydrogenase n=1 Tax=Pseudaquabacterium rugosum TaxID=2984194 RepID=A0ABU9B7F1_9BURK